MAVGTHQSLTEVTPVIGAIHLVGVRLVEVEIVVGGHEPQVLPLFLGGPFQQLEGERCSCTGPAQALRSPSPH